MVATDHTVLSFFLKSYLYSSSTFGLFEGHGRQSIEGGHHNHTLQNHAHWSHVVNGIKPLEWLLDVP